MKSLNLVLTLTILIKVVHLEKTTTKAKDIVLPAVSMSSVRNLQNLIILIIIIFSVAALLLFLPAVLQNSQPSLATAHPDLFVDLAQVQKICLLTFTTTI
jgi:hypothetical protein